MIEIPLSAFGLETVAEACERMNWRATTVQKWVRADLLPVVVIGAGRSAKFLLRSEDVDHFKKPAMGRPREDKKRREKLKKR